MCEPSKSQDELIESLRKYMRSGSSGLQQSSPKEPSDSSRQMLVHAFRKEWGPRLVNSDGALNLLLSESEDDFAGAIVYRDSTYLEDFIAAIIDALGKLGKIRLGEFEQYPLATFTMVIKTERFEFAFHRDKDGNRSGDTHLPKNVLLVFDHIGDFVRYAKGQCTGGGVAEMQYRYMMECLAHIVDHQYVILAGTEEEIASFCELDPRLANSFGQNQFNLAHMSVEEVADCYLDLLDKDVKDLATSTSQLRKRAIRYIGFNLGSSSFYGREYADFLAKYANARKKPVFPPGRFKEDALEEAFESVIGLDYIKDTLYELQDYASYLKVARESDKSMPSSSLHMVFAGNPGTGKTMIARVVAHLLYSIGIVSQNKVKEVSAADLMGMYIGQSEQKTHEVILDALDGVLFIDEAYAIANRKGTKADMSKETINELVRSLDYYKDRLVVIFAGYEREMARFIESNPGLSSRIGYTFRFEDYSTKDLLQIFQKDVRGAGLTYDAQSVDPKLTNLFDLHRRFKSFGNGRFVRNVFRRMVTKHARLINAGVLDEKYRYVLLADDVPTEQELNDMSGWAFKSAQELLDPLVGLEDLKQKIIAFEKDVTFRRRAYEEGMKLPDANLHMQFIGNPGTGKTMVARIMGQILYNVGMLPTNKFIEVQGRDLAKRGTNGQTEVENYLNDAMGGVLFIDEAYSLMYQNEAQDIIATVVKTMEDHKGEFVIMLAGYSFEMRQLMHMNPGLESRIGYTFAFEDYTYQELGLIFRKKMKDAGFTLTDDAIEASEARIKFFHRVDNVGNGRFVDKLIQEVISTHAANMEETEDLALIAERDIPNTVELAKSIAQSVAFDSPDDAMRSVKCTAVHEIGHAVCMMALTGETNIVLITVEAEATGTLGYVQHDRATIPMTEEDVMNTLAISLGGLAAEKVVFGSYGRGGSSDLAKATRLAYDYVATSGMSEVGLVQYGVRRGRYGLEQVPAQDLPEDVRAAMRDLLDRAFERAAKAYEDNREMANKMVDRLLKESTISGDEIMEMWRQAVG